MYRIIRRTFSNVNREFENLLTEKNGGVIMPHMDKGVCEMDLTAGFISVRKVFLTDAFLY